MFSIIETGGKQYKVKEGDKIKVEKLDGEAGTQVVFFKIFFCFLLLNGIVFESWAPGKNNPLCLTVWHEIDH